MQQSKPTKARSATVDLTAVVKHPVRIKAMIVLTERTASPTEIAHQLRLDVSKVAYHVRKLEQAGLVEMIGERPVRGAVEHFYRARVIPYIGEDEWSVMSLEDRASISTFTLQLGMADAAAAIDAGTFDDRPDRYLTRVRALLDEQGWKDLGAAHGELYERTLEIKEESANRIALDPDAPTISTMQLAMFFEEA
jgi:DNA-binding transcriptional ArsR family regulator